MNMMQLKLSWDEIAHKKQALHGDCKYEYIHVLLYPKV